MPIEAPGDWAVFFDASTGFADPATYTPQGGQSADIAAIFTAAHASALTGGGFGGVSGADPVAVVAEVDLPAAPAQGDRLYVRGTDYRVADFEPDGTGLVRLILEA